MALQFTMGLKPILLRIISVDGIAVSPAETLTSIGQVNEGSTQVVQAAPNETVYKGDYDDVALHIRNELGDFTLETDIVEVTSAIVKRLTGGTFDAGTGVLSLPKSAPVIIAEIEIPFDEGMEKVHFHEAIISATFNGQNIKTEMCKLHLKATALVSDDGDYVDIVYPVTAGSGAINTYSFAGGTGYDEDDILVVTQAGGAGGTFLVTSVDGSGVILTMTKLTSGTGYAVANTLPTTDNSIAGAGATISILTVI